MKKKDKDNFYNELNFIKASALRVRKIMIDSGYPDKYLHVALDKHYIRCNNLPEDDITPCIKLEYMNNLWQLNLDTSALDLRLCLEIQNIYYTILNSKYFEDKYLSFFISSEGNIHFNNFPSDGYTPYISFSFSDGEWVIADIEYPEDIDL